MNNFLLLLHNNFKEVIILENIENELKNIENQLHDLKVDSEKSLYMISRLNTDLQILKEIMDTEFEACKLESRDIKKDIHKELNLGVH